MDELQAGVEPLGWNSFTGSVFLPAMRNDSAFERTSIGNLHRAVFAKVSHTLGEKAEDTYRALEYGYYQNVWAARINGNLKEGPLVERSTGSQQARRTAEESMIAYNEGQPHLPPKYRTPDPVHQAFFLPNRLGRPPSQ